MTQQQLLPQQQQSLMDQQPNQEALSCSDSTTDSESECENQQSTANKLQFRSFSKAGGIVHQFSSGNYLFKRRCKKPSGLAYFTCMSPNCKVKFTAKYLKQSKTDQPPQILVPPDNSVHICKPCPAERFIREAKEKLKRRSQEEEGSLRKIFCEVMQQYKDTLSPAMFRFFARDMPTAESMVKNMYRWRRGGNSSSDSANELSPPQPPKDTTGKLKLPTDRPKPVGGLVTSTCKEKRLEEIRERDQTPHHTEPRTCKTTVKTCPVCGKTYSIYLTRHICKLYI